MPTVELLSTRETGGKQETTGSKATLFTKAAPACTDASGAVVRKDELWDELPTVLPWLTKQIDRTESDNTGETESAVDLEVKGRFLGATLGKDAFYASLDRVQGGIIAQGSASETPFNQLVSRSFYEVSNPRWRREGEQYVCDFDTGAAGLTRNVTSDRRGSTGPNFKPGSGWVAKSVNVLPLIIAKDGQGKDTLYTAVVTQCRPGCAISTNIAMRFRESNADEAETYLPEEQDVFGMSLNMEARRWPYRETEGC